MSTGKKVLIGVAATGALLMTFAWLGHKSVHAELVIEAPPEKIWAVLTDAPSYSEWNPVFVDVQGEYRQGATMTYQMKDQKGAITEVKAELIKVDPNKELNQFGGMRGILTFDHHWILEPVEGGTKVTQHEDYRGIGVWFWDPSWFETAYGEAIAALRDRVTS